MATNFLDYKIPISLFKKTTKFLAYHISARMWFREILNWLHVPFYDCSCPTDSQAGQPVGVIDDVLSTYNGTAWEAVTITEGNIVPTEAVTATQLTSKTTEVEVDGSKGVITTVALTDAADTEFEFTFTNASITATSVIQLTPVNTGTGRVLLQMEEPGAGSVVIRVANVGTAAFNSAIAIHFSIQ